MGSRSSRQRDGSKQPKQKKEKTRKGKNNPRNADSTQSLNIYHSAVSQSPYPNHYSPLEDTRSQSWHQSSENLPGQAYPRGPSSFKPPPVPEDHQENRINDHSQFQTFEDFPDRANPSIPPRSKPPPSHNKQTLTHGKDAREEGDDYLKEQKGKSVYHKTELSKRVKEKPDVLNVYDSPESNSRPKVRADRNYESNHDSDISFRKGDILQLINEGEFDGWYFVRNLTTGEEGHVPTNWVTMITSGDVESQKCFFNGMTREDAEEKLQEPRIEIGTYVLRPSGDGYALSLRSETELYEMEIRHYKVRVVEKGICYIDADSKSKSFSNITELIKYYTENPGLRCKLKKPLPRDIPLDELTVKLSDLKLGEKLGSRNFGSVYAGTLCSNTQTVQTLEEIKKKAETIPSILSGEPDDWFHVRNLKTREEGYVHKTWISMITSSDVELQTCFFKTMNREEAVKKLLEPGIELGTYLIRPSGDDYALSLRCKNEIYELEIRHYKIRFNDKGVCYIDADSNSKTFSNIVELIKFYSEKPGLHCKLKKPLPQETPLNDLVIKFSDFSLGETLGSGNFGSVNAGTLHNNGQVAVKSLKAGGSMTIQEFRQEAETMHKLRHPNLVSLLAICEDRGNIYIITEMMSKGALVTLLREDTDHTITFKDLMHLAIQVVEGMCYLEKKAFVHRDLRAANVLVGDGNITKIADFGMARLLDRYYDNEVFYKGKQGSLLPYKWTAPEAIKQLKFTVKSDVWSFGILLYEMVTYGDEPYAGLSIREVIDWVEEGNRLKRPTEQHCPLVLYNIMRQCWIKNSNERPNFADIKETLFEIQTKE